MKTAEITYFDDHNIGMAVDTKIGLLVPNVKQVQNKSIIDVANDNSLQRKLLGKVKYLRLT